MRLSIAGVVVAAMLSGCAASATAVPPAAPPAQTVPEREKQEEIQNIREREMVLLFQSLLQMSKREQLAFTEKQAESLLPLIKRNSSEGELRAADQDAITVLLTPDQKKYVNDFLEETRIRKEHFKVLKEQQGISDDERDQMIREFVAKRALERDGQTPPSRRNAEEEIPPGSGTASGSKNIEQQLIDVLESSLNKKQSK
jgi:hypothetical protein